MSSLAFASCLLLCAAGASVTPPEVDTRQIASGEYKHQRVQFRGVVASTFEDQLDSRYNWMVLRSRSGTVCAATAKKLYPLNDLRKLKDAEVLMTAIVDRYASWRRFMGYQLIIPAAGCLQVLTPPPADPFQAPSLTNETEPHRQRVRGFVRAVSADMFFLLTPDGRSLPVKPESSAALPRVGETVTAVGFADADTSGFRLEEAVCRVEPVSCPVDDPVRFIGVGEIIVQQNGQRYLNHDAYGAICKLTGRIVNPSGVSDWDSDSFRTLDIGEATFRIDLSNFGEGVRNQLAVGCVAEVTGLCHADFENNRSTIAFPRFQGFQLIPRTTDDIRILARPPWWTPARLMIVIGILLAALVLLSAWTVALRIVSTRRARALAQEQIASAQAELKVEERTHLAVELHDSLSQTLTGIALQVDAALDVAPGEAAMTRFLKTAQQMLASCRQELRCCLWDLRSRTFAEKDMTEAIRRTIAPHTGGISVSVRFNVPREDLSETTTHAILRIARELVVNAIRHGHATQIRIAGEHHDDIITFSVADNGCGFDRTNIPGPAQGHFGLLGIRERLNELGGSLSIESTPNSGSRFIVTLKST